MPNRLVWSSHSQCYLVDQRRERERAWRNEIVRPILYQCKESINNYSTRLFLFLLLQWSSFSMYLLIDYSNCWLVWCCKNKDSLILEKDCVTRTRKIIRVDYCIPKNYISVEHVYRGVLRLWMYRKEIWNTNHHSRKCTLGWFATLSRIRQNAVNNFFLD